MGNETGKCLASHAHERYGNLKNLPAPVLVQLGFDPAEILNATASEYSPLFYSVRKVNETAAYIILVHFRNGHSQYAAHIGPPMGNPEFSHLGLGVKLRFTDVPGSVIMQADTRQILSIDELMRLIREMEDM